MGVWGVGLYQDDVTCDVKEEYLNWLRIGKTNIEATLELIEEGTIDDEDDSSLFWFALADTQWKYGRLLPEVKEQALKHIESGQNLKRWEENPSLYKKREKVLEDLKRKLNSPQPPEKKVSKITISKPIWDTGDVLLYKIHSVSKHDKELENHKWYGKYVLLRVLGSKKFSVGGLPKEFWNDINIVGIYNWVGSSEPSPAIIKHLKIISKIQKNYFCKNWVFSFNQKELKLLDFKLFIKDAPYHEFSQKTLDKELNSWPNINTINNDILKWSLEYAEQNGMLIDETTNE